MCYNTSLHCHFDAAVVLKGKKWLAIKTYICKFKRDKVNKAKSIHIQNGCIKNKSSFKHACNCHLWSVEISANKNQSQGKIC